MRYTWGWKTTFWRENECSEQPKQTIEGKLVRDTGLTNGMDRGLHDLKRNSALGPSSNPHSYLMVASMHTVNISSYK